MKKMLRNDKQLNKLSRWGQTVATRKSMCVVLGQILSASFPLTYFFGLTFNPQLNHFLKFVNWLCCLFHQVILLHSKFFCLVAFTRLFFSRFSLLFFPFFTLSYSFFYFSIGCSFSLLSSFGYFLLIWFILFHYTTTIFSTFFLVYSIYCSTCNTTSLLLLILYTKHMLFPYIVQPVLPNSFASWFPYRCN
jgi:hypothetical protein